MNLTNWIYLAIGLGLGFASRALLNKSKPVLPPSVAHLDKNQAQQLPAQVLNDESLATELKHSQLAYLMAQQMSQFKGGFLARTSHELRSPLNSLIGLHQLILSDLCDDPAEERKFVSQAHQSALQLLKLMDEVLNVSRIEHGTNKLEIQPLQLSFVLDEVYNITYMMAANRNYRLQLTAPNAEIYILADPRWFRQAILNLIDAAISYMDEGNIYISAQAMPENNLAYIWLDVPVAASTWNEPVDLMQSAPFTTKKADLLTEVPAKSLPGLTLLLSQTLLEVMHGNCEILPVPTDDAATRIQIAIPLLIPETTSLD
ncbi:sensor histidine kinase [Aliterella atlantica]|uniref:histidine kinase n=1 Tax=Aliterella atlantica CENA595 TaxID=1618023 RepID=A0A0D8ZXA0_9CYAN|nr:HAMP domain-containing sensor histidine kinase [Aliterella atlantica]KJH73393.1 hypothetical protein UH38_01020 [Aliterella atlantica CENA595]